MTTTTTPRVAVLTLNVGTIYTTPEAAYFNGQGDTVFPVNGGYVCVSENSDTYASLRAAGVPWIDNVCMDQTATTHTYSGANRAKWVLHEEPRRF
jgi:hypothetical protein